MTKSKINQSMLAVFFVGLMTLASFGQENATNDVQQEVQRETLSAGDHTRTLMMGEQERTYLVHVPESHDPEKKTPVVLALHGAAMNGSMMVWFSGLTKKSEEAGFIVVYPSGTGTGPFLVWNAGGFNRRMSVRATVVARMGQRLC